MKVSNDVLKELERQRDLLNPDWSLNEALAYILAGRAKAIQLQTMERIKEEIDNGND